MKRTRKRPPIPQHEFGFVPDMFDLIQDTATDGERLCRECRLHSMSATTTAVPGWSNWSARPPPSPSCYPTNTNPTARPLRRWRRGAAYAP